MEIEQELARRLSDGVRRCCHVHESEGIITFFVERLSPEIRSLLQAYRDNNQGALYLELIEQARYDGDAILARNDTGKTTRTTPQVVQNAGNMTRQKKPLAVLK